MRLVSVGEAGVEQPGVLLEDRVVLLGEFENHTAWGGSVREVLANGAVPEIAEACVDLRADLGHPLDELRLGPPVPDAGKLICVGLNYRGHAEEQGKTWPEEPLLFAKATSAMVGCRDRIVLPADDPDTVDYEVELAAVIGTTARNVSAERALDHVGGWMVGNDVSARRWQKADGQWFRAKSCDTFYPCGPALVTVDEVPDYRALRLRTTIGGEVLQDAAADDLIHDVPALIAYVSRFMTLQPGDIISTGTPAGVGCYREPKRFLRPGDEVRCAIAGLGELVNEVLGA